MAKIFFQQVYTCMRILPFSQFYRSSSVKTEPKKMQSPSFGRFSVKPNNNFEKIGDGDIYKSRRIKNYTALLRNARFWCGLPYLLQDKFPNGAKIFDYACSTGHESASIVISLKDKLPQEQFKKFMPIYAFDSNANAVKQAKSREIMLDNIECELFNLLDKSKPEDYFIKIKLGNSSDNTYYKKSCLSSNIITGEGDLLKDMNKLRAENQPLVLFFRNASQFMTKKGRSLTALSLFQMVPPKSLLIIGDMDVNRLFYDNDEKTFGECLLSAGFKKVENIYPEKVIDKNKQCKNGMSLDFVLNMSALMEQDGLEPFCFEKL